MGTPTPPLPPPSMSLLSSLSSGRCSAVSEDMPSELTYLCQALTYSLQGRTPSAIGIVRSALIMVSKLRSARQRRPRSTPPRHPAMYSLGRGRHLLRSLTVRVVQSSIVGKSSLPRTAAQVHRTRKLTGTTTDPMRLHWCLIHSLS